MTECEVLAMVEQGYVRLADMPPILDVTKQRCHQLVKRDDFPSSTMVNERRLWLRADVERWRDEVWARPWQPARADSDAVTSEPDSGLADPRKARSQYLVFPKGDSQRAYEMILEAAAAIGVEIPDEE